MPSDYSAATLPTALFACRRGRRRARGRTRRCGVLPSQAVDALVAAPAAAASCPRTPSTRPPLRRPALTCRRRARGGRAQAPPPAPRAADAPTLPYRRSSSCRRRCRSSSCSTGGDRACGAVPLHEEAVGRGRAATSRTRRGRPRPPREAGELGAAPPREETVGQGRAAAAAASVSRLASAAAVAPRRARPPSSGRPPREAGWPRRRCKKMLCGRSGWGK